MGAETSIAWTDHTFNPWWGCVKVSPGCAHCYADTFAKRVGQKVWGVDAPRRFFGDKHWNEPLKWDASAKAAGVRRRVFCASMADVFEDRPDLVAPRARLFDLIDETPNLVWLLLTKRPENVVRLAGSFRLNRSSVWLGTTVEGPETMWRRDVLTTIGAHVRFLSVEPQVAGFASIDLYGIEWVIQGGESGPGSRPFNVTWARWMRDECRRQGARYFLKQLGAKPVVEQYDQTVPLMPKDAKGGDMAEWPADLRIREVPAIDSENPAIVGPAS